MKGNPPRVPLARREGFLNPFPSLKDRGGWAEARWRWQALPGTEARVEEERVLGLEEMEKFY